jgi:adenylate cyclase
MADLFVSYARVDKARVAPLVAALEAQGWSVWWDSDIAGGQEFDALITRELDAARAAVVVWTPASVASRWVRGEARAAADRGVLAPVQLDSPSLPLDFRAIHTITLDDWNGDAQSGQFQDLTRALSGLLSGAAGAAAPAASARPPQSPGVSICVLPFANMSGEHEQEYFSDGITEDIITDLSKVSALAVVARNTAFTFKGKSLEIPQIARQLRVSHVLEGSVRKAGGRVRITAQLIDGASGNHLWAERYDRNLDDIFALQDEISEAIVAALKLKLLPEEKKAIEQRGTDNAEAYNLYLMARQQQVSGHGGDVQRYETIVRMCRRVVEIDPQYALAWALMAQAQVDLRYHHGRGGDGGLEAAEQAIALDGSLAEAHAVRARVLYEAGQRDEALEDIERALKLDPESWEVNRTAGRISFREHRIEDAIRYWEKASALMEGDFNSPSMLTTCYTANGDTPSAMRYARLALERTEKVLQQDRSNSAALGYGCIALALLGQAERSRDWMERALLIEPDSPNLRYNFACVLAIHIKDAEGAVDMLGPFFATASASFIKHAKIDPDLDPVREHPRFQAMLAEADARLAAEPTPS